MMKNTINPPYRKLKLLLILPIMAGVFYAFATPEYKYVKAEENSVQKDTLTIVDTKTITGKVISDKGNPLKGAAVIISGTNIGTITDDNGVFKLQITEDSPIVISHVGFESQKISPDTEREMSINMTPVNIGIDQVTVTGYGEPSNQATLGSTIRVQTKAPLQFGSKDGSGTQPLIIIDGVIAENQNVHNISPETIESINVLKDASATAVYGEKGKNGVILISTKKGASGSQNNLIDVNLSGDANAQKDSKAYTIVEEMPEFPGGDAALRSFIAQSVKYPSAAQQKGAQGKVYVLFVVTKTGKVANARIVRGADPSLDQEALRVVNSLPTWKPGKQGGKDVDVEYTIPINFVLEGDPKKSETATKEESPVFFIVEEMPEYPGGDAALRNFIASSVKYPVEAQQKGIQGKVFITFVVTKAGKVTNAKVARGVAPSLDQEAIRVVESLPAWIPGKQGGQNVDVQYTIPINFVLEPKAQPQADPLAQKGKLIIVPNPTQNQATVTLEGSDYSGKLEVSLFDSYGKLLLKESKNGPSFTLSVTSLTPGNYVVVASDGSKQYQGHLVVNK